MMRQTISHRPADTQSTATRHPSSYIHYRHFTRPNRRSLIRISFKRPQTASDMLSFGSALALKPPRSRMMFMAARAKVMAKASLAKHKSQP
jgi:hypothetical protein